MSAEKSLQWGLGVRRADLFTVLGPEFASRLHVAAIDSPEVALAKVRWQLGELIYHRYHRDERTTAILRASYNLDQDRGLTGKDLLGRRQVLSARHGKDYSVRSCEKVLGDQRKRFLDNRMFAAFPAPPADVIDSWAESERLYAARWHADPGPADSRADRVVVSADRAELAEALPGMTLHFLVDSGCMVTTDSAGFGRTLCAFTDARLLQDYRATVRTTATEVHTTAKGRRVLAHLRANRSGLAIDPLGRPGQRRGHHWSPDELAAIDDWRS